MTSTINPLSTPHPPSTTPSSISSVPLDLLDLAIRELGYSGYRGRQKEAVRAFVEEGKNVLVIAPTGAGKSGIFQVLPYLIEGLVIVVSPLIALQVDQVLGLRKRGIKADYINSMLKVSEKKEVERRVTSGETQMLYVAPERLDDFDFIEITAARGVGAIVADECFPAGTMVETLTGSKPIESLVPGEQILSRSPQGTIRCNTLRRLIIKRCLKSLVEVIHASGSFVCTEDHKIWTENRGYVYAKDLRGEDLLVGVLPESGARKNGQGGPLLQSKVFQRIQDRKTFKHISGRPTKNYGGNQKVFRGKSSNVVAGPPISKSSSRMGFGEQRQDEREQSFFQFRGARKGFQTTQGDRPSTKDSWWKRSRPNRVRADSNRLDRVEACSFAYTQRLESNTQDSKSLQDRYRLSGEENSLRDRWSISRQSSASRTGYSQGFGSYLSRVEGVEIYQRSGEGGCNRDSHIDVVFDLEVENDHNYFANGVLVSNCHLICQWGMGFRPDYSFIDAYRVMVGNPPIMGLSATATPKMCEYIIKNLRMRGTKQNPEQVAHITSGFDRPNLYLNMKESCKGARMRMLVEQIKKDRSGAIIIYFPSIDGEEGLKSVYRQLEEWDGVGFGDALVKYHGRGMKPDEKTYNQQKFMSYPNPIALCTCAFGMGIDKANVRQVIHFKPPGSMEAYYQEIGRAGRDGLNSICTTLFDVRNDMRIHKFFLAQEFMRPDAYVALVESLADLNSQGMNYHEKHLARLERYGILERDLFGSFEVVDGWKERLEGVRGQVEAEYEARKDDIVKVESYLTGSGCRRNFVLNHFGDHDGGPRQEKCCWNCERKKVR